MNIKQLIAQFKLGGQKARFSHEDVLFILNQIDEHTQALEVRTIHCIAIKDDVENHPFVKTFLVSDFVTIDGRKLVLKNTEDSYFVNETETKSIILQLEGMIMNIDLLNMVIKQMDSDSYWNE